MCGDRMKDETFLYGTKHLLFQLRDVTSSRGDRVCEDGFYIGIAQL